jgi:hypothetical protein
MVDSRGRWRFLVVSLAAPLPTNSWRTPFGIKNQNEGTRLMRPKLVLVVSALAAVVGSGLCFAIVLIAFSSLKALLTPNVLILSTLLLPLATIVYSSIFVYRHTARRRKLQAFLTGVLATVLTIGLFLLAFIFVTRTGTVR